MNSMNLEEANKVFYRYNNKRIEAETVIINDYCDKLLIYVQNPKFIDYFRQNARHSLKYFMIKCQGTIIMFQGSVEKHVEKPSESSKRATHIIVLLTQCIQKIKECQSKLIL